MPSAKVEPFPFSSFKCIEGQISGIIASIHHIEAAEAPWRSDGERHRAGNEEGVAEFQGETQPAGIVCYNFGGGVVTALLVVLVANGRL